MYDLININSKRKIKILELLLNENSISIYDIMKVNSCSERTVYNDIEDIFEDNIEGLSLVFNNRYLTANLKSNKKIEEYVHELIDQDKRIKLIFEVLYFPFKSVLYYSEQLEVSDVYLRNLLKEVNLFLEGFGSRIIINENKYHIEADDEVKFRVVMAEYINTSPSRLNDFNKTNFSELMYAKFSKPFEYDLSKGYMITLEKVSDMRFEQGFKINKEKDHLNSDYDCVLKYLIAIMEDNSIKFDQITNNVLIFCEKNFSNKDLETFNKISELFISILVRHIVLGKIQYIQVDRLSRFYLDFYSRYKDLVEKIKKSILDNIGPVFDINTTRFIEEVIFFTYISVPEILKEKIRKIYIVSDLGKEHCESLRFYFSSFINNHNFVCISSNDIDKINLETFDGIISTYDLNIDSIPIIYVADFPTPKDLLEVHKLLYL